MDHFEIAGHRFDRSANLTVESSNTILVIKT